MTKKSKVKGKKKMKKKKMQRHEVVLCSEACEFIDTITEQLYQSCYSIVEQIIDAHSSFIVDVMWTRTHGVVLADAAADSGELVVVKSIYSRLKIHKRLETFISSILALFHVNAPLRDCVLLWCIWLSKIFALTVVKCTRIEKESGSIDDTDAVDIDVAAKASDSESILVAAAAADEREEEEAKESKTDSEDKRCVSVRFFVAFIIGK